MKRIRNESSGPDWWIKGQFPVAKLPRWTTIGPERWTSSRRILTSGRRDFWSRISGTDEPRRFRKTFSKCRWMFCEWNEGHRRFRISKKVTEFRSFSVKGTQILMASLHPMKVDRTKSPNRRPFLLADTPQPFHIRTQYVTRSTRHPIFKILTENFPHRLQNHLNLTWNHQTNRIRSTFHPKIVSGHLVGPRARLTSIPYISTYTWTKSILFVAHVKFWVKYQDENCQNIRFWSTMAGFWWPVDARHF